MSDIDDARAALDGIDALRGFGGAPVTRLGGMTNRVFRIDGPEPVCLRLPGPGTAEYINRGNEMHAAREAARAGVGPEVPYADAAGGILVTRHIGGAVTMTPGLFRSRRGAPGRAGEILRRLHGSGARFNNRFELFAMIDDYLRLLATRTADLPAGYHDVLRDSGAVRAALAAHPLPLVACHCDPLCENFLDTGRRMWLVDWEYSGMNDPMWDLGDLSVEAGFGDEEDEELLLGYFGTPPGPGERGRMVIYKAMCDLLWTLWGLIQHANANPAEDFWAYANNRFARCRALMARPDFAAHVAAVAAGPH
jgi:thiamine kinase-like enzyme